MPIFIERLREVENFQLGDSPASHGSTCANHPDFFVYVGIGVSHSERESLAEGIDETFPDRELASDKYPCR